MWIALLALVMPLLPFQDDWTYLTAPNPEFAWRDLLPGAAFWRPFDALWGGILGRAPWLFPWVNRIVIVLGHVLCVYLVAWIVDALCEERRGRFAAEQAKELAAIDARYGVSTMGFWRNVTRMASVLDGSWAKRRLDTGRLNGRYWREV